MTDSKQTFNIGVSRQLMNPDMSAVIKEIDFSPLLDNTRIKVSCLPDVDTGELTAADVAELDAGILYLERITDKTVVTGSRLTVLARYGVGFDTLDIAACTAADVAVAIAPEGVRRPVATSVIALMLALTLKLKQKDSITRDVPRGWEIKSGYNGLGLVGRTLGIIGFGNIGSEVARLATPFDLDIIAHDPHMSADKLNELGVKAVALDDVFLQSDIVSLNCPLNESTRHIVNQQRLQMMKPGAYLINTARGPVIDEMALIAALQDGVISGAGLDVFEQEPPAADNPLLSMDNVILAPHALCFTDQCMGGLGEADIKACLATMYGRLADTLVNPEVAEREGFKSKLAENKNTYREF